MSAAPAIAASVTASTSAAAAAKPVPAAAPQVQEFSIRVPKTTKKKHNVMRFNAVFKVDFKEWKHVKMERENNLRDFKPLDEDMPKFGAGSEFGREAKEEARKKKYGMASRKYKAEDQPWILQANGKAGKKFRGLREGGVSEHAAYYVFTHAPDGAIEAFPLHEWYNFQPIARYKALSAEEAEEQFNRRNKVINYFSLMMRKRLRNDEDGAEEELLEGEKSKKPSKKEKELKISEMDEWMDSDDDDNSDSDKEDKKKSDDEGDNKKNNKKKGVVKKKKKKQPSDDEAFEESDDGDEEGRECDYISDSSASDSELEQQKEIKSVAEEDALRKLLASDEEDEDEEQEKKDDEDKNEEGKEKDEKDKDKTGKPSDKKKDKKKVKGKKDASDSSSDMESGAENKDAKDSNKPASTQSSRSTTPTSNVAAPVSQESLKRTFNSSPDISQAKRIKYESYGMGSSYVAGSSESGITEDAVRRYLMRKPMTTTELLQKFKSKKTGLSSDQIVNIMTKILKNLAPASQKIKGKMYFSIKAQPHHQPPEAH